MKRWAIFSIITWLFVGGFGCEEYKYIIHMEIQGQQMVRTLVCGDNTPAEQLERLAKLYPERPAEREFKGVFNDTLPADVGGASMYRFMASPMGRTAFYVERFRGRDDQAGDIEKMFRAVDTFVDVGIDWLASEMGDNPQFENLRTFCSEDVRRDVKNMLFYTGWLGGRAKEELTKGDKDTTARILMYLMERKYITIDDLLSLELSEKWQDFVLTRIHTIIAQKLGYDSTTALLEKYPFLRDDESMEQSLMKFLPTTQRYRQLMSQAAAMDMDVDEIKGESFEELFELLYKDEQESLMFALFSNSDEVTVTLACPQEPMETNGAWDAEKQTLAWSRKVARDEEVDLPFLCYAILSQPDNAYQEKHFGKIVLEKDSLFKYNGWYQDLTESQRRQWDSFVEQLPGNAPIESQLEGFAFTDMPGTNPQVQIDLKRICKLIIASFEDDKETSGENQDMPSIQAIEPSPQ